MDRYNRARRVLISGGSGAIGGACVRRFASGGDKVMFIYNSSSRAAEKLAHETGATPIRADLQSSEQTNEAAKAAISAMGGVDVLINAAGIAHISTVTDTTDEEWKRLLDTNLSATFILSRELSRGMIREHYGRIINIGSVWGGRGASCEVAYSASKAGMRGLTASLGRELGPSGITVNCIEPGVIETPMNSMLDQGELDALVDATPLCRLGRPEEVAELAYFLASEQAGFITAAFIPIDGGFPS